MFAIGRKHAPTGSAGCWRHTAVVGDTACERCRVRCCHHCWVDAPRGSLCIECALDLAGVRARRRRVQPEEADAPSPLATLSWEGSADLIDLAPAHRRRRPEPVMRDFFRRAA